MLVGLITFAELFISLNPLVLSALMSFLCRLFVFLNASSERRSERGEDTAALRSQSQKPR
jgi:hypothetical protein